MLTIREATISDLVPITALLKADGLRTEGVCEAGARYWVAEHGSRLIGAIGLECGETAVLLRSAVVLSNERRKGVGRKLTERALEWAWSRGYQAASCFSTDAGDYWITRGFRPCSVDEVVRAVPDAPQVRLFDQLGWLPTEAAYRITPGPSV